MSRDGKHNTILLLSKEPFVRGPIRFVHRRCKAEVIVLSGLGYRSTRYFLFRAFSEARKRKGYKETIALMEGFLYASFWLS
jgi:hypothetical protein